MKVIQGLFGAILALASAQSFASSHAVEIMKCQALQPGNGQLQVFQVPGKGKVSLNIITDALRNHAPNLVSVDDLGSEARLNFQSIQNGNQLAKASLQLPKALLKSGGSGQVLIQADLVFEDSAGKFSTQPFQARTTCTAIADAQL